MSDREVLPIVVSEDRRDAGKLTVVHTDRGAMFIVRAGQEVLHSVRSAMCIGLESQNYFALSDLCCPISNQHGTPDGVQHLLTGSYYKHHTPNEVPQIVASPS